MPNAFVKHIRARPPMSTRARMENNMASNIGSWLDANPLNNPLYIKNSDTKPLNGGNPQIASEPVRNKKDDWGIRFNKPPNDSIFMVCVA